jgi:hypothetical protein
MVRPPRQTHARRVDPDIPLGPEARTLTARISRRDC